MAVSLAAGLAPQVIRFLQPLDMVNCWPLMPQAVLFHGVNVLGQRLAHQLWRAALFM